MATKADRYEGIDGLKAYAIIGIALMHVLANGEYGIGGFVFERLIPSFTNLVFLFMMVSGFGIMPRTSAKCEYYGHWCELDTGGYFCVLHAVPVFLLPDWK